jgi:hypothetical protein
LKKIENMFYAALTIGTEYSFVKKLFDRSGYSDVVNTKMQAYDNVKDKWFMLIAKLQEIGITVYAWDILVMRGSYFFHTF